MVIVRLIHGIHAKEGNHNMAALLPHLQATIPKTKVELFEYGFMGFWEARWGNDNVACALAMEATANDVWITHSNGAVIAFLASHYHGAKPKLIININPALDRGLAANCLKIETIHSKGDRAVYWSQFLPFHLWGDQGKVGYKGHREDVLNHNASASAFGNMAYKGHCDLFSSSRISQWAYFLAHRIEEQLGEGQ